MLVSVAAAVIWLLRRRRRSYSQWRTSASSASASLSLTPPLPPLPCPAANQHLPHDAEAFAATTGTLSRSPSRVQLDATSARFGLDIGGSLTKFIYLEQLGEQDDVLLARARRARERAGLELHLSVDVPALNGTLHFAHFQTSEVEKTAKMLKRYRLCDGVRKIHATGGGAHKYRSLIESTLNTVLSPCNELEAVVLGICLSKHPLLRQSLHVAYRDVGAGAALRVRVPCRAVRACVAYACVRALRVRACPPPRRRVRPVWVCLRALHRDPNAYARLLLHAPLISSPPRGPKQWPSQ